MSRYFLNPETAPLLRQMAGLETRVLTGLSGEQMMMVLSATLPGRTVPIHTHPHEQIGMVYAGQAVLRIGDEERIVNKGDFYCTSLWQTPAASTRTSTSSPCVWCERGHIVLVLAGSIHIELRPGCR